MKKKGLNYKKTEPFIAPSALYPSVAQPCSCHAHVIQPYKDAMEPVRDTTPPSKKPALRPQYRRLLPPKLESMHLDSLVALAYPGIPRETS